MFITLVYIFFYSRTEKSSGTSWRWFRCKQQKLILQRIFILCIFYHNHTGETFHIVGCTSCINFFISSRHAHFAWQRRARGQDRINRTIDQPVTSVAFLCGNLGQVFPKGHPILYHIGSAAFLCMEDHQIGICKPINRFRLPNAIGKLRLLTDRVHAKQENAQQCCDNNCNDGIFLHTDHLT